MKKINFFLSFLFITGLLINISCKKEVTVRPITTIVVTAGPDTTIQLPYDHAWLSGKFTINENNPVTFEWKQITGPGVATIERPHKLDSRVYELAAGVYGFEITVANQFGDSKKDTMMVTVLPDNNVYTHEVTFNDLPWECFWGCSTSINNINSIVPAGQPFNVYFKAISGKWRIVVPANSNYNQSFLYNFWYSIVNGRNLEIYTETEDELYNTSIKIEY